MSRLRYGQSSIGTGVIYDCTFYITGEALLSSFGKVFAVENM